MKRSEAMIYRQRIEQAAASLPDTDAVTAPEMFRHWKPDIDLVADERICHEDRLYRVVQTHTSQDGWEPDRAPALFTEIPKPGEIPVWKQPTGAQDAYMTGDRVYYPTRGDDIWTSQVDSNVWEPGVYGWRKDGD